jgi:hypothetical protein
MVLSHNLRNFPQIIRPMNHPSPGPEATGNLFGIGIEKGVFFLLGKQPGACASRVAEYGSCAQAPNSSKEREMNSILHDSYRDPNRRAGIIGYNPPPSSLEILIDWLDWKIARAHSLCKRWWRRLGIQ